LHDRPSSPFASGRNDTPVFLDKNENPFRLPPSLREEIRQVITTIDLNRYPDPEGRRLKETLSELTGIPRRDLVIGNGGDEILTLLFSAYVEKGSKVLSLSPTFSQYPELCRRHKAEWIHVPLGFGESEISFDEERFMETVFRHSPDMILLDSPNNPTGKPLSRNFLMKLSEDFKGVLMVDEAYGEFAKETFLETFRGGELPGNLCILKTLSKAWGMAGLRIGYAACAPSVAAEIEKVRDLYNVGLLSQEIAGIVLQYREWMESRVLSIRYMRDQLVRGINRVRGWRAFESESNFVLVRSPVRNDEVRCRMEEAGIHVKFLELDVPGDWFRVSIGKEDELGRFMNLLQAFN
jgi:histidinol-phosphate aminotransferase